MTKDSITTQADHVKISVNCPFCGEYAIDDEEISKPSWETPETCWNCGVKIHEVRPLEYEFVKEEEAN